jgi:hypothetical protein
MEHHGDDVCGGSYVNVKQNYCTILTVEKLRGGSFLFPPEPIGVKLLTAKQLWTVVTVHFLMSSFEDL